MTKDNKSIGHVVPHTHWDREWRYPIWKNRLLLVEFTDQLLDTLDKNPDYRCFVMDGQCIPIEDYLEIRPEKEDLVRRFVKEGRLAIGPWYTLPDLYPIDGECLIRNLLKGMRLSTKLGGYMKIGYNSFGWGQTAQFPQIYKGFGFDFIIAAKRVSGQRAPKCEFLWEAPDGTRVLTSRLGGYARGNLFMNAIIPIRHGLDYTPDNYGYVWERSGVVIHDASPRKCQNDYFKLADKQNNYSEKVREGFQKAWEAMDDTTVPECRLLMGGSDFTDCQPDLPHMIEEANAHFDNIKFVHSTIEEYAERLKEIVTLEKLPVVYGELRDGLPTACSANALATRIYLKMANKQAQNVILHKAEPMASLLAMIGAEYPQSLLAIAWKHLLQSHAHDSINGVTQDKTAADTLNRIQQAIEIGDVVNEACVGELVKRIDLSQYGPEDILILAVNPSAKPIGGVFEFCVDTPQEYDIWEFSLEDSEGKIHEVQPISREEKNVPVNDTTARPWPFKIDRHMAYADLGQVPAGGYKVFKVKAISKFDRRVEWWPPIRISTGEEISPSPQTLENEYLRAIVESDGTITLHDKTTGQVYKDLHYFEDAGDIGDYWVYYPPDQNQIHTSRGCPTRIWCEDNGPLAATLLVETTMTLPQCGIHSGAGIRDKSCRSEETNNLIITSWLTLKRGSRRLEIRTKITNTVEDHRLRVIFPTDLNASHSEASGHFIVDKRPIEPAKSPDGTYWPEMQTLPQQHFVDISDGRHGLAILNNCLTEYEVLRDNRTCVAITFFRSVQNRICTESCVGSDYPTQKGGQSLREMIFEYALYPHAGTWNEADVYAEAETLNTPAGIYQTAAHEEGSLPVSQSLFSIEPANLILSAFKKAEDRNSYIIRMFNPTDETLDGSIKLASVVKNAWLTNLNEERESEIVLKSKNEVPVVAAPQKIVTVEIETK